MQTTRRRLHGALIFVGPAVLACLQVTSTSPASVAGDYDSEYGDTSAWQVHMDQDGTRVTGIFQGPDPAHPQVQGSFEGAVAGNTLSATWCRQGYQGRFRIDFSSDGSTFDGTFTWESPGASETTWKGTRRGSAIGGFSCTTTSACSCDATCQSGRCIRCTPACSGKACGSDGCGGSCGTCVTGKTCSAAGQCTTSSNSGRCQSCISSCSGMSGCCCGSGCICESSCTPGCSDR